MLATGISSAVRTTDDYLKAQEAEAERTSSTLGQSDFLKLMTTQLMNQDPLQPMGMESSWRRWRSSRLSVA